MADDVLCVPTPRDGVPYLQRPSLKRGNGQDRASCVFTLEGMGFRVGHGLRERIIVKTSKL